MPAKMSPAGGAQCVTPGIPGEPAEFAGGFSRADTAGGGRKTADLEDNPGWIGKGVLVTALQGDAPGGRGNAVPAVSAEDAGIVFLDNGILLARIRPAIGKTASLHSLGSMCCRGRITLLHPCFHTRWQAWRPLAEVIFF